MTSTRAERIDDALRRMQHLECELKEMKMVSSAGFFLDIQDVSEFYQC